MRTLPPIALVAMLAIAAGGHAQAEAESETAAESAAAAATESAAESAAESGSVSGSVSGSESVSVSGTESEPPAFGATARVPEPEPGAKRMVLDETRELPGALGDPLRIIDTLPGVTPIASGLPYGYVRGAPPATTGFVYDGIALPQLYHFALGPSVLHPRLIGPVDFHAGVAPARYGRRLGATLAAAGPNPDHELGGEVELRLLDVNGYAEAPIGEGGVKLAGRYGYPGLVLSAFNPDTTLSYWDYQGRFDFALDGPDHAEIVVFGSYDRLDNPPWDDGTERFTQIELEFHRLEARLLRRENRTEIGGAMRVGYDTSSVDNELAVEALSVGPRMWVAFEPERALALRVGADMLGSIGDIDSISGRAPSVFAGRRQIRVDLPFIADAGSRSAGGAYAEATLRPADWTAIELGLRGDVWLVEGESNAAVDPRLRTLFYPTDAVELHAAIGLTHQPAVFLFPLPGLTEVALDRGLQEAIQSEAGIALETPLGLWLEATGFLHRYDDLLLPELYAPEDGDAVPTVDAWSYGAELFLRRPSAEWLSGWLSYTLAWARAGATGEPSFSPEFDIRHVVNLVLQLRWSDGWQAGTRIHLRSGRPFNQFDLGDTVPTYAIRLPWFARADARIGYEWQTHWGAMLVYAEWLNLTLAEEVLGAECLYGSCRPQTAPAIFLPNLGARAQF